MTAWVLVPVLRAWRRRHPGVELDVKEYTSADAMAEELAAGQADLTVGPRPTRADEPLVGYHAADGFAAWLDEFAASRGVALPDPALRTGFPRTAAQLAAAGMGVALVPFSALTPMPGAAVRSRHGCCTPNRCAGACASGSAAPGSPTARTSRSCTNPAAIRWLTSRRTTSPTRYWNRAVTSRAS